MSSVKHVLAVDLHSSSAVALFCRQGRLLAVGRLNSRGEQGRKQAAREVFGASDSIDWLVSAGTPSAQATWERAAMRQGVRVQRVTTMDWQAALLRDGVIGSAAVQGRTEDEAVLAFARNIAERDGVPEASRLTQAEARAVCIGVWAHRHALGIASDKPALMAVGGVRAAQQVCSKQTAKNARLRRVA